MTWHLNSLIQKKNKSEQTKQLTCCNELARANVIGSNRLLLANINDINSRSRARLCIALRLVGGSEAAGCNNGFP